MKNLLKTIIAGIQKKDTTRRIMLIDLQEPVKEDAPKITLKLPQQPPIRQMSKAYPKGVPNMSLLGVFSEIKNLFTHIFVDGSKIVADAPATIAATKVFWNASLPVIAAVTIAVSEKGLSIPADSAAFMDLKAWLAAAKTYSMVIEKDFKDLEAVNASTQPVVTVPPPTPPAVVVNVAK